MKTIYRVHCPSVFDNNGNPCEPMSMLSDLESEIGETLKYFPIVDIGTIRYNPEYINPYFLNVSPLFNRDVMNDELDEDPEQ